MSYTLEELLDRAYDALGQKKDNSENVKIDAPKVIRMNRKTFIANFEKICIQINRDILHVSRYVTDELCCTTSLDSKGALVCGGNFQDKGVCKILTHYFKTFVQCDECKSLNTEIVKKDKITFKECQVCKSSKAVA